MNIRVDGKGMASLILMVLMAAGISLASGNDEVESVGIELQLASPFGEHMVLQRGMPVPVWGWGKPGVRIEVGVAGKKATTLVDSDGCWRCELPALNAGGAYVFTVSDGCETITYTDVLVGEVWICCGQSNMGMGHRSIPDISELVADTIAAKRPVRSFKVENMISFEEEARCFKSEWSLLPPDSAVAASFAIHLQAAVDVPVAVVMVSWGSSSIQGWMPADMGEILPEFKRKLDDELGGVKGDVARDIITISQSNGGMIRDRKEWKNKDRVPESDPKLESLIQRVNEHKLRSINVFARTRPNLLYNAMLHPLAPMACRGMAYYQGEANGKSLEEMLRYGEMQPLWLKRIREEWGREGFHLLNVMLPRYTTTHKSGPNVGDLEAVDTHSWAIIRESQMKVLQLPNTSVVSTIDLGGKELHPKDKMPIGRRLALLARRDVYGEDDLQAAGPMFTGFEVLGNKVRVSFKDGEGLRTTDGAPPRSFWISENGSEWVPAAAQIAGEQVELSVPDGVRVGVVRYAYAAIPDVNLVNGSGLPAYPFNTSERN